MVYGKMSIELHVKSIGFINLTNFKTLSDIFEWLRSQQLILA